MEIKDISYKFIKTPNLCGNHSVIFPKNIFCVIAGATGCGKTNLLVNLLMKENVLNFTTLYVYSPTLHQPAYEYLKLYFNDLEEYVKNIIGKPIKIAHFFDTDDEIKDPSELDKNKNHIMIFDDVMLKDQSQIKDYFCRGRHNNVSVFYLCQSLNRIAKHCIKDNANVFILFDQNLKTLQHFYESHLTGDMDFEEFKVFCNNAWAKPHGFVVINKWGKAYCGKYWDNYSAVYIPSKYSNKI